MRMLSRLHEHPRDSRILFKEEGHEYTITGIENKPTSVTTLIHKHFPEFNDTQVIAKMMASPKWSSSKYFGKTAEQIKNEWNTNKIEASTAGTKMHKSIEDFLNGEIVDNDTSEFRMFLKFWDDIQHQYPDWEIDRTEWLIYDNSGKVAGSIDAVMRNKVDHDKIIILDWKRSKEIKYTNKFAKGKGPFANLDDCNYIHYSLQLNIYRHILETCYNKEVMFMMLAIMHPNNASYQCIPVGHIAIDSIWNELIN